MAALSHVIASLLVWGSVVAPLDEARAAGAAEIPLNDCISSDNGDPVLTGMTVTPFVDVTTEAKEVSFSLTVDDVGGPGPASGLRRVEVSFGEPLVDDFGDTYHVLHKDASGSWVGSVVVQPGSRSGPWQINGVFLTDRARNHRALWTEDLETARFPTAVAVTSTPDTTRPRIVDFRSTPGPVDTRRTSRLVTFTATVFDRVAGVAEVDLSGDMNGATITGKGYDGDFLTLSQVPGSPDTFRGSMRVRRWVGDGTWKVRSLSVRDKVDNFRFYSYNRLGELGFRRGLKIISRTDTRPPELTRFALRPSQVDVRTEDGRIVVRAHAVDTRSGVDRVTASVGRRYLDLALVSGTRRDGVWRGVLTLPRCTASAGQRRVNVDVADRARNDTYYRPSALAAHGWPDSVDVTAADHRRPQARIGWQVAPAGPVRVRFYETVSGVTPESATVRRVFGPRTERPTLGPAVPGTWACLKTSGAVASCASGRFTRARFTPDAPLLASRTYQMTLNPEFSLAVTDRSGNPFDRDEFWLQTTS
jgi:hypothetical protein